MVSDSQRRLSAITRRRCRPLLITSVREGPPQKSASLCLNLKDNGVVVTGLPVCGTASLLGLKIMRPSQYSARGQT